MACQGVTILSSGDKAFKPMLNTLFEESNFNGQCSGRKGLVNRDYAIRYMRPRATVVAWIDRVGKCDRKKGCLCGFGLGFVKEEFGVRFFYVDLVCSQEKMGGSVLGALEAYAKRHKLADVVALRAAVPPLVKIYEKKGYKRQVNACTPPSRAARALLRALDRNAAGVAGASGGVYTDGTRLVSSVADAWRASNLPRPRDTKALPPKWYYEAGYHGWWMSKCIS